MVEIMDENIGRIFEKLKELDLDKNTFVLFCSDNGATKIGSNGELHGFKSSLWEGGHRVPAIAWYPSEIKSGRVTDCTVLSMDVLPTLLLLYLPHEAPHFPYQGRNDKADRLTGKAFEARGSRKDKKLAYKEMVEIMDENIGRVFEKLKGLNLDKNTFVLFVQITALPN